MIILHCEFHGEDSETQQIRNLVSKLLNQVDAEGGLVDHKMLRNGVDTTLLIRREDDD